MIFFVVVFLAASGFEANHKLGEAYIQRGDLKGAIPYLERAQRIKPSDYVNGYDLSLALIETGNAAAARTRIRNLLKRRDTAELHDLLGQAEESLGHFDEAVTEYRRAAAEDANETNLFDLGNGLIHVKRFPEAIQVFQSAVARYPASAKLRVGLGVAFYSGGRYDDAVETLCKAVDLNPADPRPMSFLEKMYDVSPRMAEEVTRRLAGFVQLYPKNATANYYYAVSLWKREAGRESEANLGMVKGLLKSAVALDPKLYEARQQLGILYEEEGKLNDAIAAYEAALALRPDLDATQYRLAQVYLRMGQREKAGEHLKIYRRLHAAKQGTPTAGRVKP
ncbi:MAG: tetratricopeptide repeat protein [Bryobacteraceae bacterium]